MYTQQNVEQFVVEAASVTTINAEVSSAVQKLIAEAEITIIEAQAG